jgi:integrase
MDGYVARKGDRWYAVIYEGLDPVTGKERRRWHPAGTSREEAERLAAALAAKVNGRNDQARSLIFGAYLLTRWLPGKKLEVTHSTWDGYRRKIELHIIPTLGKIAIRRLRPTHLERLYDDKLHPKNGKRPLAPKTVLEIHLIIRGALNDGVRRGIVTRNVAQVAHAPKLASIPKVEQQAWTAPELRLFLREAAGHRLFAAFWLLANTGLRRSELLGLQWDDIDLDHASVSINRVLVSVGYQLHESRGKTPNSRRSIDLDPTTVSVLSAWKTWQSAERGSVGIDRPGGCSPMLRATRSTPTRSPKPSNGSPTGPGSAESDSMTCAILTAPCSSKPVSPSKSFRNGSGMATRHSPSTPTSMYSPACKQTPPAPSNN